MTPAPETRAVPAHETFLNACEKIHQFLSSIKKQAHQRKSVPSFCFTVYKSTSQKKLQKQCSNTLTDDFVINLPPCLCTQQNPVTSAGRTSVDIGASAKLELVDKFC